MKYESESSDQATNWQQDLRSELICLLKIDDFVSRTATDPFRTEVISSQDNGRYVLHEMEINSTSSRRIQIVVTVPKTVSDLCPAVVAIAGHGGDRHTCYTADSYYRCAHILAEQDYVTISTCVSQHDISESGRTLIGERLWDLIRCVDFLSSMEEVDVNKIGCMGKSLGGEMVMWLAAIDLRIKVAVSSGFLTKMDQMENNHCMCWKFAGLRSLVDFADIYSLIAPRPLLCQNGLQEPPSQFPVDLALKALSEIEPIYDDLGYSHHLKFIAHQGGHEIHLSSLISFIDTYLGPDSSSYG